MEELKFKSLEEELADINKIEGEERALDLRYVTEYVKKKEGEGKYNLLLNNLQSIGFVLPKIEAFEKMSWIPMKIPVFFVIASAKFFKWKRQDIIEMGRNFVTFSPLLKIFVKYFISPQKTIEAGTRNWRKHYTRGDLEFLKYDENEKEVILRLKNFKTHPVDYLFIVGSFEKMGEIALGIENIKGDGVQKKDCYEFIFRWE